MDWSIGSILIQIAIIMLVSIAVYAWRKKRREKPQQAQPRSRQSAQELQRITRMRARRLNVPLSERTRPTSFNDIVGQEEGIRALRAALCGPNPQHVLIFGPPGIGKTCAARLVLEEAKKRPDSPFGPESLFVELDATCVRFDERAIADPLIGSVHDPIYQGAGAMGAQGIPQPKPGAVTRAHCGILFLDEIGELHPMQMNKLLKVLEDRCVRFESAYYSPDNTSIPQHIHDIFLHGLPADFRLVGATTRRPEELPPALRSRCLELYFKPLNQRELMRVAAGAIGRAGFEPMEGTLERCAMHAHSGRDVVNIMQLACGLAHDDGRLQVTREDVDWVVHACNYTPRLEAVLPPVSRVGHANALAVSGAGQGVVMEIECTAGISHQPGVVLNGIVEEEEIDLRDRRLRRKSTARGSVENVLAAIRGVMGEDTGSRALSINIPGGMPVDGPSAGVALTIAVLSAIIDVAPIGYLASTGEMTISGDVRPVGGVREKIAAAEQAGARIVLIPEANWEESFAVYGAMVRPVSHIREVAACAFPDWYAHGRSGESAPSKLPLPGAAAAAPIQ